jgi:hypothetical protein
MAFCKLTVYGKLYNAIVADPVADAAGPADAAANEYAHLPGHGACNTCDDDDA